MRECAACGSRRIRAAGRRIRDITEVTPPPPPVTTRHTIHVYECAGCGRSGMEPETGLPGAGMLGPARWPGSQRTSWTACRTG